jgi:hypothetical protein
MKKLERNLEKKREKECPQRLIHFSIDKERPQKKPKKVM